jgi:hypothetical protein
VSTTVAAASGVRGGILPACRAVQAMHVGSYDTLGTTYEAVKQRMNEEGLKASDDMWEYYLSDRSTDPATWRTLVVWPVLCGDPVASPFPVTAAEGGDADEAGGSPSSPQ